MARRRQALAARRSAQGYTQDALAAAVGVERSTLWRWEYGVSTPLPPQRRRLAVALGLTFDELDRILTAPDVDHTLPAGSGHSVSTDARADHFPWEDPASVLIATQKLRHANVGSQELDTLADQVRGIVERYEHSGPVILGAHGARLRWYVHELMSGNQRLSHRRRLFHIGSQIAGLLGYMAVNTGQFRLADTYCDEASYLAEEADDIDLLVWVSGTRSFAAYYEGRYEAARDYAVEGRQLAPDSAQSIRLLVNGEARAQGKLGNKAGADTATGRALELLESHDVPPDLTPCISFAPYGYARVAANAATAYVPLGDTECVRHYIGDLDPAVERADSDWSRALIRLDHATALLRQDTPDLDEAMYLGKQALDSCPRHPIRSVWQRARELRAHALRWPDHRTTKEYDEALHAWRALPATQAIAGASA